MPLVRKYPLSVRPALLRPQQAKSVSPLRADESASRAAQDADTVRLQGILSAAGLNLPIEETRAISTEERAIIERVAKLLRVGWFQKNESPPEPTKQTSTDTSETTDDEVTAHVNQVLAANGTRLTTAAIRKLRNAERKIHDAVVQSLYLVNMTSAGRDLGVTADTLKEMGIELSINELRRFYEMQARARNVQLQQHEGMDTANPQ